jgi:hypothetical protein
VGGRGGLFPTDPTDQDSLHNFMSSSAPSQSITLLITRVESIKTQVLEIRLSSPLSRHVSTHMIPSSDYIDCNSQLLLFHFISKYVSLMKTLMISAFTCQGNGEFNIISRNYVVVDCTVIAN